MSTSFLLVSQGATTGRQLFLLSDRWHRNSHRDWRRLFKQYWIQYIGNTENTQYMYCLFVSTPTRVGYNCMAVLLTDYSLLTCQTTRSTQTPSDCMWIDSLTDNILVYFNFVIYSSHTGIYNSANTPLKVPCSINRSRWRCGKPSPAIWVASSYTLAQ